jgi:hypothetical protein
MNAPTPSRSGAGVVEEIEAQALYLVAGELLVAHGVAATEDDPARRAKMESAVETAFALLTGARPDLGVSPGAGPEGLEGLLAANAGSVQPELAVRAAIEWTTADPFGPSSLKHAVDRVFAAAERPARAIGLDGARIESVRETIRRARHGHRDPRPDRALLLGIGAEPLLRLTVDDESASSIPGLGRKGVLLEALLTLSGGPALTGGAGISAGAWLLVPQAGPEEDIGPLVTAVLEELAAPTLEAEVVKAEATFSELYLQRPGREGAADAITAMDATRAGVAGELAERRRHNDEDAETVAECERMLASLDAGLAWMREAVAA